MNVRLVKETALSFLHLEPKRVDNLPFFVEHPFFNSEIMYSRNGKCLNVFKQADLVELKNLYTEMILTGDIYRILSLLQVKYHLVFLKYIKDYLTLQEFSQLFGYMWVNSENPNQDVNVSVPTLKRWFRECDKTVLMEKDDLKYYHSLPQLVQVYRGVAVGRNPKGLSYTPNKEKAEWFAHRFDQTGSVGYVISGCVHREDILAYFNTRREDELVVDEKRVEYDKKTG